MSQPYANTGFVVPTWLNASLLEGTLRGIERESLRMQSDGYLSKQPHPDALGAALTHPHITTDYSEALLEFITPPHPSIQKALNDLADIHAVAHEHLPEGERLWPMSMPCMLDKEEQNIPLAQYGTSNLGRFKTLYRHGLAVRYGRRMQTIAGVHYNLSFSDALFDVLQQHEQDPSLKSLSAQDYRSQRYFGLIRNFIRYTPMVIFLLGASPTVCGSFVLDREHDLQRLVAGALHLPYATALRMGKYGYQNSAQKQLGIRYDDLNGYLSGLEKAVKQPYAPFTALGLDNEHGEPIQINDHTLQIENEYYSLVRPKQTPEGNETPSQALKTRGVGYVELRSVDVDPYCAIGITEHSAAFLEVLALYCLLSPSPNISEQEQVRIELNQANMVANGRAADATFETEQGAVTVVDWLNQHLEHMQGLAQLFDQSVASTLYTDALALMKSRVQDPEQTLSAHVIKDMLEQGGTWRLGAHLAQQHAQVYDKHELSLEKQHYFDDLVHMSKHQQHALEQANLISFDEYLRRFRS
ncbi:glutamate--cysteine ligase [Acinetobacter rathckeae]|uniref:glutamate--cysteine ligase n=1 Tax=Acinetobacter rathckeae TaxID=2605272 RepID=UPI0018A30CE9|nr:glutamate--cysteine ligase [Acinetobacter rathckeae]MBF7688219.1 glutamate--cysteine ligase [Acinetobacter rathckeae]MBF7695262.1 glutamate--cysteine ligase [Acinetobacter rathckeae]